MQGAGLIPSTGENGEQNQDVRGQIWERQLVSAPCGVQEGSDVGSGEGAHWLFQLEDIWLWPSGGKKAGSRSGAEAGGRHLLRGGDGEVQGRWHCRTMVSVMAKTLLVS